MKNMIEKLQFWQQPEYHNYHVGAAVATLKEAESYIRELEAALKPFADEADEYEGLGVQDKDQIFVPLAACRQARKALDKCGE